MRPVELLVSISALAFVAAGAVVGVRLMRLASRTGGLPERVMGFSLFFLSAVAWPLMLVVSAPVPVPGPLLRLAVGGGGLAMALAWSGVFLFTWRVFRPGAEWARMLAGLGIAVELGAGLAAVARVLTVDDANTLRTTATPAVLLLTGAQVAYVWSASESFRYRALLRRRIPLGLADPVVADRFGLWAWTGVFAAGATAPAAWAVVFGGDPHSASSQLIIGICGLVCSGTLTLAFLPPATYVRMVRGRAPGAEAPASAPEASGSA
jgi:hypothetical protein